MMKMFADNKNLKKTGEEMMKNMGGKKLVQIKYLAILVKYGT